MIFQIRGKLFVLWGREWTKIHDNPLVSNHLGPLSLLSSCMRPCVLTPDGYPRPWGSPVLSLVSLRSSWSARESSSRHLGPISAHMSHMVSQGGMVIFNRTDTDNCLIVSIQSLPYCHKYVGGSWQMFCCNRVIQNISVVSTRIRELVLVSRKNWVEIETLDEMRVWSCDPS